LQIARWQMNVTQYEHIPVLLNEVLQGLNIRADGSYLDCTFGRGGHCRSILELLDEKGRLFAIDKDPVAISSVSKDLSSDNRFRLFHGSFTMLKKILESSDLQQKVNGILFDLGVSSPQLDDPKRGFSFRSDGHLDMRMDNSTGMTAAEWIMHADEAMITKILIQYGEERYARRIARAIVQSQRTQAIQTTGQLASIIQKSVPPSYRYGRLHCATRTFQAIRIALNQELECLSHSLQEAVDLLTPGGRICVISFHSLEDRIVKQTFRALAAKPEPVLSILTKKPLTPTLQEKQGNPRSRSAKLRVAIKINNHG